MNWNSCAPAIAAFVLTACNISTSLLKPHDAWLVEPDEIGFEFEDVVLKTGPKTSVHGWFIPNEESDGRTVILCHGNAANISFYHPYYSFLHEAGYHVFLFDYRGFGKSEGSVSVRALFTDTESALAYVESRADVDPDRIVLFGTSLGSIVAMRTAARHPELAGIVIEDATSPRQYISRGIGSFLASLAGLLVLPSSIEPANNAKKIDCPALFLCGEWDSALLSHLEIVEAFTAPAASWVQPRTAHAPSGLLEHDLEYQASVARFLDSCMGDDFPRVRALQASPGVIQLQRFGPHREGSLAVQLCVVGERGQVSFSEHWLEGDSMRVSVDGPYKYVEAWPYTRIERVAESGSWRRERGPLAVSSDALQLLESSADSVRESLTPYVEARALAAVLEEFEEGNGMLAQEAQTELIPVFLLMGEALLSSPQESDHSLGTALLERCVAAEPSVHGAHCWPASPYRVGFRGQAELAKARKLLQMKEAAND